jgi:hypothetical protein
MIGPASRRIRRHGRAAAEDHRRVPRKLRKERAQAAGGESCIETVWGKGCALRAPDSDAFDRQLAAGA